MIKVKTEVRGEWLNYRINQGFSTSGGGMCERERIKFYRAKKIFEKIINDHKELNKNEFESFFYGYMCGANYDTETCRALIFLKKENGF